MPGGGYHDGSDGYGPQGGHQQQQQQYNQQQYNQQQQQPQGGRHPSHDSFRQLQNMPRPGGPISLRPSTGLIAGRRGPGGGPTPQQMQQVVLCLP